MLDARRVFFAALALAAGCEGPRGPAGAVGQTGPAAQQDQGTHPTDAGTILDAGADGGSAAQNGCPGLAPGATAGINAAVTLSSPANGMFFVAGERAKIGITVTNNCGQRLSPSSLGTASLYLSGPRLGALTSTAASLLNCVTDRTAADRQHHFINLIAPSYADPTQKNLVTESDGTLTYTLAPISSELPGTYTVGVWLKSSDGKDQALPHARSADRQRDGGDLRVGPVGAVDLFFVSPGRAVGQVVSGAHHPGLLGLRRLRARLDADRDLQALPQPRRLQRQSHRAQGARRASRPRSARARRGASRVRARRR